MLKRQKCKLIFETTYSFDQLQNESDDKFLERVNYSSEAALNYFVSYMKSYFDECTGKIDKLKGQ